jgi:hypothetical protein
MTGAARFKLPEIFKKKKVAFHLNSFISRDREKETVLKVRHSLRAMKIEVQ